MDTLEFIKTKQKMWALQNEIKLVGSKIERGDKIYTSELRANLFQEISESTKTEFSHGDGNEFGNGFEPGKMQALHSSSVLGVNVFEYWKANQRYSIIAKALRIPSVNINRIQFEEKFVILNDGQKCPNIDVNVHYKNEYLVGIECKFTEPFQSINSNYGFKAKYLTDYKYWNEFPELRKLAESICPDDNSSRYLNCAQLIKHILGMYAAKQSKDKFRLLYIYQPAFFENNEKYVQEIELLQKVLNDDQICFQYMSWQELIKSLNNHAEEQDMEYINYLIKRYI